MPEIRYKEVYKDSKLISKEPYTVSDKELEYEKAVETIKQLNLKSDLNLSEIKQAILAFLRVFRRQV